MRKEKGQGKKVFTCNGMYLNQAHLIASSLFSSSFKTLGILNQASQGLDSVCSEASRTIPLPLSPFPFPHLNPKVAALTDTTVLLQHDKNCARGDQSEHGKSPAIAQCLLIGRILWVSNIFVPVDAPARAAYIVPK